MGKALGQYLRTLREKNGRGLKRVAPKVGVSYSYLSKLENGFLEPSQATIERLARYYGVDPEVMAVLAGKLPDDLVDILQSNPEEAIRLLRDTFGDGK